MGRRIIAAGPWHQRDEFTLCHREVLCAENSRHGSAEVETYVCTTDVLNDEGEAPTRSFGSGDYFHELEPAIKRFADRVKDFAFYTIDTTKEVSH